MCNEALWIPFSGDTVAGKQSLDLPTRTPESHLSSYNLIYDDDEDAAEAAPPHAMHAKVWRDTNPMFDCEAVRDPSDPADTAVAREACDEVSGSQSFLQSWVFPKISAPPPLVLCDFSAERKKLCASPPFQPPLLGVPYTALSFFCSANATANRAAGCPMGVTPE